MRSDAQRAWQGLRNKPAGAQTLGTAISMPLSQEIKIKLIF
jgi:hypothetical protein